VAGNAIYSVPFSDGKLNWHTATLIGNLGEPGPAPSYMHFGKDPSRMVGGQEPHAPHLFDIAKGTRVPIEVKPFLPHEDWLIQLGLIPGTDSLFMKSHDTDTLGSHRIRLATYSVDAQGKLRPLGSQGYWDPKSGEDNSLPTFVQWLSDGTPVFGYSKGHHLMELKVGTASKRTSFHFQDPLTGRHMRLQKLVPRPHATEGIILASTENNHGAVETPWAIWVNLDAGTIENAFELPQGVFGIQFSADGRTLFGYRRVRISDPNETEIVKIDFMKRLRR